MTTDRHPDVLDRAWRIAGAPWATLALLALTGVLLAVALIFPQQPLGLDRVAAESWLAETAARYGSLGVVLRTVGVFAALDGLILRVAVALLAFNLRGRAPSWERGGWQPYDLQRGDELPIELAFRYSNADIDRDLFDLGVTTYDPSSQETRTLTAALAAYLAPLTRLTLGWVGVIADHELTPFGGTGRDSSFVLRLDQRF